MALSIIGKIVANGAEQLGVEYVPFDTLLKESDFVILTCAATAQNKNLMNKSAFQKMKKSATLINIARGTLVNQDDLAEALQNGSTSIFL
ncbi:Glyoxylate reductase/hydroxypyruvate reductase [Toxocara canis]|uniref:Glyoxylate reductase/hydroxypyruvate reductase n=1 Tax=Toxocara canis TaxID=6265 RepID=A0A0B2VX90_TOXCA|nr:Glyoxylate reductase/hydroxypyruvate reductase [Toxocara canis]